MTKYRNKQKRSMACEAYSSGSLVWGKLEGCRWWPAMVIEGSMCEMERCGSDEVWVFWFGTYQISKLKKTYVCDYKSNFELRCGSLSKTNKFKIAIVEAAKEYATFLQHNISSWSNVQCIEWSQQDFPSNSLVEANKLVITGYVIPEYITAKLQEIIEHRRCVKRDSTRKRTHCYEYKSVSRNEENMKKVVQGTIEINDLCLACYGDQSKSEIHEHPIFNGGICSQCLERLKVTLYSLENDGVYMYCTICGCLGPDLVCFNADCNRVFCSVCTTHLGVKGIETQQQQQQWSCFLCAESPEVNNGLVIRREDWKQNILNLYTTQAKNHSNYIPNNVHPIRVLSLFDGIGSGLKVLDNLGFVVEAMFVSEVDPDAIDVTRYNFGDRITYLGDVTQLTEENIINLGPIDLLLGGSPCNDLSFVNPARKGIYDPTGTGILFFDFYRVWQILMRYQKNHHMFWLFENVVAMSSRDKNVINRFLECEPAMIDAQYFSAQKRSRHFWGNIPGLGSTLLPQHSPDLDSVLIPGFNRSAIRKKLRTVTTNLNSLMYCNGNTGPVLMKGKDDLLWITELEAVFGFPYHYTDVGNLSTTRRRQLLGKAWSLPVVQHILKPLRSFFSLK